MLKNIRPSKIRKYLEEANEDTSGGIWEAWLRFVQKRTGESGSLNDVTKIWLRQQGAEGETLADLWYDWAGDTGFSGDETGVKDAFSTSVLEEAVWYIKPEHYDSTNDRFTDLSGNGNHAVLGSTVGADTNDPVVLPWDGDNYAYFPDGTGQGIQTPDTANLDISGAQTVVARISSDDWDAAGNRRILARFDSGTTGSFVFFVNPSGGLSYTWIDTAGPTANTEASSVSLESVGIADGQDVWVAALHVTDDGAGNSYVNFYYSTQDISSISGLTLVQLGDAQVFGSTTDHQDSAEPLQVGGRKAGNPQDLFNGKIYHASLWNGILGFGGTAVATFDMQTDTIAADHSTVTNSDTSRTWTVSRIAAGSGHPVWLVDEPCILFDGVDDYMTVSDASVLNLGDGEDMTLAVTWRCLDTGTGSAQRIIDKDVPGPGWGMQVGTTDTVLARFRDDSSNISDVSYTVSDMTKERTVLSYDDSVPEGLGYDDGTLEGTDTTALGDSTNTNHIRLGSRSQTTPASFYSGAIYSAALFKRPLTAAEVAQLPSEIEAN